MLGVDKVGSFAFEVLVDSTRRRFPDGVSAGVSPVRSTVSRKSKSSNPTVLVNFEALPEPIMEFSIQFKLSYCYKNDEGLPGRPMAPRFLLIGVVTLYESLVPNLTDSFNVLTRFSSMV